MFDRSTMDGYALWADDVKSASRSNSVRLLSMEEIPAGHIPQQIITRGTSSCIMTGGPIPQGANAVVKIEDTEISEEDGR